MNYLIAGLSKPFIFAAITMLFFIAAASSVDAQTLRKYKAGDKIEMSKGITYEIIECRIKPNTREEECDFVAFFPDGSASNTNTSLAYILRRDEMAVKAEKKRQDVINGRNKKPNPTTPEATGEAEPENDTPTDEPEITVTAQQLYSEYNNNDTAARRKYVGKTVRVTGAIVYTISETKLSARFSKTYSGNTIQCLFQDLEQIPALNTGETLTLIGKPLGSMTSTGVIFSRAASNAKLPINLSKPSPNRQSKLSPMSAEKSSARGITPRLSTLIARNKN
jgi:hypothetical protein